MEGKKIVMLAVDCLPTNVIYNSIQKNYGVHKVILEEKQETISFLKKRIKKQGIIKVAGQVLFQLVIVKLLAKLSKNRINEIILENNLDINPIPESAITKVKTVNSELTIEILQKLNPDLIILSGTRIVSQKVLASVPCKFINAHAGITPKYRGVHGAYWALVNDDSENSGVTIHMVDAGIDTGEILAQGRIEWNKKDNFVTYPWLQLAKSIDLFNIVINQVFSNVYQRLKGPDESQLWYHPTFWSYLYNRWFKGVK